MNKEQIQEFTLRITQSNRSGIIVIMYEIMETYLADAFEAQTYETRKEALRKASRVIYELRGKLDFQYEVSENLAALYDFWAREIETAIIKNSTDGMGSLSSMIASMREAFTKVHEQDNSPMMMQHSQQVYAGLTYGRGELVEMNAEAVSADRGFFV